MQDMKFWLCSRPGVFGGEVSPETGIYGSVIFF